MMTAEPSFIQPQVTYPQVIPAPGSRLEQLLGMREAARAAFAEAEANLKAIEAGIRSDAAAAFPGQAVIDIAGAPSYRPALRLRWHDGKWTADAARMQAEDPRAWEKWRKQGKGYWQLHDLDAG